MTHRSKQQALMFLLGAVLVGGALGASADHVIGRRERSRSWAIRHVMYDDLELTPAQRAAMDSAIDEKNRRMDSLMKPIKPVIDSIRGNLRAQFYRIFTPEQRAKFEARVREDSLRRESAHRAREQEQTHR